MLRRIVLQNFAHFFEKQELEFDKGAHFMIGENSTGKTSLLEGIRRCMSVSNNNGLSFVHDESSISFVTCVFYDDSDTIETKSSFVTLPPDQKDRSEQLILKIVVKYTDGQAKDVYADVVKKDKDSGILVCIPLDTGLKCILTLKDVNADDFPLNIDAIRSRENDTFKRINLQTSSDYFEIETKAEGILKKYVDSCGIVICTFKSIPLPGSDVSEPAFKKRRKQVANSDKPKTDILKQYLDHQDKLSEKEIRFFNIITHDSVFPTDHEVESIRTRTRSSQSTFRLVPESIYEAKVLAILLASPIYKTVCLDDAESGLTPQMMERIRDFVLPVLTDKVVLLTTHSQVYLARLNITRTFLFQGKVEKTNKKFSITNVKEKLQREATKEKILQMMSDRTGSYVFFAKNILFVEGKSDELFMTNFFQLLVRDRELLKTFAPGKSNATLNKIQYFLSGFCIIPMDGSPNAFKFREICQTLQLHDFFLLDYDVMKENIPKETQRNKCIWSRFCMAMYVEPIPKASDNPAVLEDERMFIWTERRRESKGKGDSKRDIENVVLALYDSFPQRKPKCRLLDRNKKLFLDKDITYEEICNIVKECLQMSVELRLDSGKCSDIYRLVKFFLECYERNIYNNT